MPRFKLSNDLELNVRVTTLDLSGRVLNVYRSGNTIINAGRRYLRDLLCTSEFRLPSNVPPDVVPEPPTLVFTRHRPKYVAVGVGGAFQTYAYPGGGSYVETVTTPGLERPVPIAVDMSPPEGGGLGGFRQSGKFWQWMKQIEPQNPNDVLSIPDDFSVVFRCVLGPYDVSFIGAPGEFGLAVPLTEFLLLTSEADAYTAPCVRDGAEYQILNKDGRPWTWTDPDGGAHDSFNCHSGEVIGAFAYNITVPQIKTPNNIIVVEWEQRS